MPEDLFARGWSYEEQNDRIGAFRRISQMTGQTRVSPCDYNVVSNNGIGGWKKYDLNCLATAFTKNPSDSHAVVSVTKGKADEVIGKGVRIGPVSITITDDKVTRTIWDILPWLADLTTPEERRASKRTINDYVVNEVFKMRRQL